MKKLYYNLKSSCIWLAKQVPQNVFEALCFLKIIFVVPN